VARLTTPPGFRQKNNRYYWEPSPTIRRTARDATGREMFPAVPLGTDYETALTDAARINDQVASWRAGREQAADDAIGFANRSSPRTVTVGELILYYKRSQTGLLRCAPNTQRRYIQDLEQLMAAFGDRQAATIRRRAIMELHEDLARPEVLQELRMSGSLSADRQCLDVDRDPRKVPAHARLRFKVGSRRAETYQVAAIRGRRVWLSQPVFQPAANGARVELVMERLRLANGVATMAGILFGWAIKDELIAGPNPAKELDLPRRKPRQRVASVAEVKHLVATADEMDLREIGDAIIMAFALIQRECDVLDMMPGHLIGNRFVFQQQKTGPRIDTAAPEVLLRRLAQRKHPGASHFVASTLSAEPIQPAWFQHLFARVREAAAADLPAVRTIQFKDFRRSGFVHLARQDVPVPKIVAISGHSLEEGYQMVEVYCPATPDMADDAMRRMVF